MVPGFVITVLIVGIVLRLSEDIVILESKYESSGPRNSEVLLEPMSGCHKIGKKPPAVVLGTYLYKLHCRTCGIVVGVVVYV